MAFNLTASHASPSSLHHHEARLDATVAMTDLLPIMPRDSGLFACLPIPTGEEPSPLAFMKKTTDGEHPHSPPVILVSIQW
ncbi:hypothetical protein CGRA01v4_11623 [Colletotrichum graminicola]|nr:hypothetical protein CGRA01v4_11623 [Colletotrichum graminicola]